MATAARTRGTNASGAGVLGRIWAGQPPVLMGAVRFGVVCAGLVLALRAWLQWVSPFPGDRWVVAHHDSVWLQPTPVLDVTTFFSVLGTPALAAIAVGGGAIYGARAEGVRGLVFVLLSAAGVLVGVALKDLSGPTPLVLTFSDGQALNFPSGHVVYATTTFGALAILARRAGRTEVALPLFGLVLAMGPARITARAHLPSDVIAGYLVGAAWLVLIAALVLGPGAGRRRR